MTRAFVILLVTIGFGFPLAARAEERASEFSPAERGEAFAAPEFQKQWYDGKAELAGYELTIPRYGEIRHGTAVTIFVSEPLSNSVRVKADPGKHPASDEIPVMKLNLVQDFQTGIYDYNLMTSTFVALRPANGHPAGVSLKVSFSAQEWCGQVYHHLLFDHDSIREQLHSYFDGEADRADSIAYPSEGLSEDAILLWARGMAWPFISDGETREVPLLRSLQVSRLAHVPVQWEHVKLARAKEALDTQVPVGTIRTRAMTATIDGGDDDAKKLARAWTVDVEEAWPHRIVRWRISDGTEAKLVGSDRLTYWQMHGEVFEKQLSKIGLHARDARSP